MNFILNLIMATITLVAYGIFGVIILILALGIRFLAYVTAHELAKVEQPQPYKEQDNINTAVVKITKQISKADDEDKCWAAQRAINRFSNDYSDHPDINKEEQALRYLLAVKVGEVFPMEIE